MQKRLLYIVALVLTGITNGAFVYGQSSTLDKLQGKTWASPARSDQTYWEDQYTRDTQKSTRFVDGRADIVWDTPFYLSDELVLEFDDTKIGTAANGKYIILKGDLGGIWEGPRPTATPLRIMKLDDAELQVKSLFGSITTYRVREAFTLRYVLNNTPTVYSFSPSKKTGFLEGYDNYPVNSTSIQDKLYTDVQLRLSTDNRSSARGKFLRRLALSNGYSIIVVTFGDLTQNRTDVLCMVDQNGNCRSTLECWVTVNGMTVKSYTVAGGEVYIRQVVPGAGTPSPLRFEDVTSFSGILETSLYNITNGSFVRNASYSLSQNPYTRTFTREKLSDPDVDVINY